APMIPLDDQLRPKWLFEKTVHEGCDRGGYYEQGEFADMYGQPECLVKIGCTMPGFPDKFMPFMDAPPGSLVSSTASKAYGRVVKALRNITQRTANKEPKWRHPGNALTTGYAARY